MSAAAPAGGFQPRVITVGGGRGGIGKSAVAAQLAWSLAQAGRRVAVVDLDLAAPAQHRLLGAAQAAPGVPVAHGSDDGEPTLEPTRHANLALLAGTGPRLTPAALGLPVRLRLAEQVWSLPVDVVVVDVGAGLGYDAVDLLELGHHRLVVSSCQPASVQEGFALIKGAVWRLLHRRLARAGQIGLLEPAVRTRQGERMNDILARVQSTDPTLHAAVVRDLVSFGGALLGTQVPDATQVGALQTMSRMAAEYLGVAVPLVGWLRAGARLPDLGERNPAALSDEARAFRQLAEDLLTSPAHPVRALRGELVTAGPGAAGGAGPGEPPRNISLIEVTASYAAVVEPPPPAAQSVAPAPPPPPRAPATARPAVAFAPPAIPAGVRQPPPPSPPPPGASAPRSRSRPAAPTGPPIAAPPPLPAEVRQAGAAALPTPVGAARSKPVVYVRPPRKRRPDPARPVAPAEDPAEPARPRRLSLPGMPPRRAKR